MTTAAVALLLVIELLATHIPPRRAHHALAWDGARERVVLTGGSTMMTGGRGFTFYNDLWEFDGARWHATGESGEPLSGVRLAFDTRRGRVLSFGGYAAGQSRPNLRLLESGSWRELTPLTAMPVAEGGFVYDVASDRFIAFGGSAAMGTAHGQTWTFRDSVWKEVRVPGPPARQAHVMVYDELRQRTVVFGGIGAGMEPATFSDVWEFDGNSWARVDSGGGSPGPRHSAGAAYDARRGLTIVFGGMTGRAFHGDLWAWNGRMWRKLADASATGPAPRTMGALAYDRKRDRIVLFGGRMRLPDGDLNDTWDWDGARWSRVP